MTSPFYCDRPLKWLLAPQIKCDRTPEKVHPLCSLSEVVKNPCMRVYLSKKSRGKPKTTPIFYRGEEGYRREETLEIPILNIVGDKIPQKFPNGWILSKHSPHSARIQKPGFWL